MAVSAGMNIDPKNMATLKYTPNIKRVEDNTLAINDIDVNNAVIVTNGQTYRLSYPPN